MSLSVAVKTNQRRKVIRSGRASSAIPKKAVLLAGGEGRRPTPLAKRHPAFMFPVVNKPIIEHNIEFLARKGLEDVVVVLSANSRIAELESIRKRNDGRIRIHLHREAKPRGTAGILGDVTYLLENQPFLVMNCSLYIEDADIEGLMDFHRRKKAAVTVGVRQGAKRTSKTEAIEISDEGMIKGVHIIHHSRDRRSPWLFSGIYLFAPEVFEFIDPHKYLDIKEQLIPALQRASLPVYAYELDGYYRSIDSLEDYLRIHWDLFELNGNTTHFKNKQEVAERVWVGRNTTISPGTYLMGPVVIGDKCSIAKGAQIIGPAVIGDGCEISAGAVVRESILWNNVSLEKGARSEYCIVTEGLKILEGERLKNSVAVDNLRIGDMNLMTHPYKLTGVAGENLSQLLTARVNSWVFNFTKRAMDISISLLAILILSPFFILIALAIKLDSPGPVFFIQKRCGKDGKLFGMFKFRTMFVAAEKMQVELLPQKDTDGPMFKMINDPRITRVGKILRKTSLDEIPQLVNVIKGEMSLVGPRPLIMDEMKFSPSWRDTRLKVKPGITGLWQVQGRSETPFHEWIKYDIAYVKKQSIWLDLKILFKTLKVVFKKAGAY
jgi:lipopolysaccharide/colanic/teichoic acid biosynthesis glycosyltransferase/dTDP-glucose pyrophosphorylase